MEKTKTTVAISKHALQRLPMYLNHLKSLPTDGVSNISATTIAQALGLNDVQVRKDLAMVSRGRPKIGYIISDLILDIEQFLGYSDTSSAVLVGAGNLGRALLCYNGIAEYGFQIVAAFDTDETMVGKNINGKPVLYVEKLVDLCKRMNIRTGILTVPYSEAQSACNRMVEGGVLAILNFTHAHLRVPSDVLVKSENMAGSLAVLSKHLSEQLYKLEQGGA